MKRALVRWSLSLAGAVAFGHVAFACSGDDGGATVSNTGGGANASGTGGTSGDASINLDGSGATDGAATCPGGCPEGQVCINGFCVTQTSCNDDEDCQNDTYCEPNVGCVPWGQPPTKKFDPACQVGLPPGNFAPTVKCEFSTPPPGDKFPNHRDVQATPMVVNFNVGASGMPSIVAPFTATVVNNYTEEQGVIRVLRGDDCSLEANLGGGEAGHPGTMVSSSPVAVADLDGDGSAEVVSRASEGHLVAFTKKSGVWSRLWISDAAVIAACNTTNHRCAQGWAGPSIHDLDDDGIPEVILEGSVVDGATGKVRSGNPAGYASYGGGLNPVLANLDQDAAIELTNGAGIWQWAAGAWTQESYYSAPSAGFVAVADFGAYGSGLPADNPELTIVSGGFMTIRAADASVVLGPIAVPGGGGGAPTIADYDGDGLPEVGVAGQAFLTVYDIDCGATPRAGGTCTNTSSCDDSAGTPGACPSGILWSRRTQDNSSNVTGSSVFDFEDDGKAEVVYADECFVRVYDGTDGRVLFSQFRSSCTWFENPIVADTDGNFRADLVTPSNLACSDGVAGIGCTMLTGDGVDQQFPGVRCKENKDCLSGSCDQGFCRCTTTSQCCSAGTDPACTAAGFKCVAPPAGTAGTGNTCRAGHPTGVQGIRVYSDANDRWVRSRTIWNQHAYHVTHVNENGTVPKTSAWQKNWKDPDLNNFRQNVPGDASGKDSADVTAGIAGFTCGGSGATLKAPICNRGTAPLGAGVNVGFYDGTTLVCSAKTSKALNPGECETVSCVWTTPPAGQGKDIQVVGDDGGSNTECKEGNNQGTVLGVTCQPPS